MPRWPLSLQPLAAPTLPSRSRRSSSSLTVKLPTMVTAMAWRATGYGNNNDDDGRQWQRRRWWRATMTTPLMATVRRDMMTTTMATGDGTTVWVWCTLLYCIAYLEGGPAAGWPINTGWRGKEVSTKYKVLMGWKFINSVTIQLGGEGNQNFS